MPAKSFIVLGVSHRVQGDMTFVGAINDPDYARVVRQIISVDRIDFVGEECALDVTVAEKVAQDLLGAGHYLNLDPLIADRGKYGIGMTYCPPSLSGLPVHRWIVANNEKREQIWVDRIVERTASTGLLICGFLHAFSVAAKLLSRGFEVEARTYLPWEKLVLTPTQG